MAPLTHERCRETYMMDDMTGEPAEILDFEAPGSEYEEDDLSDPMLRQWEPGIDAFVVGSKEHTGFRTWLLGIFWPKCKSSMTLVAGERSWFQYQIDPAFERPIIGQPKDAISVNPASKYGQGGHELPVAQVEIGEWNSYAKERWACRIVGALAGFIVWVMDGISGDLGQEAFMYALVGWVIGHELSLRFEWRIRRPLDYQKFRVQQRCWWAISDGLWMRHCRKLKKG